MVSRSHLLPVTARHEDNNNNNNNNNNGVSTVTLELKSKGVKWAEQRRGERKAGRAAQRNEKRKEAAARSICFSL